MKNHLPDIILSISKPELFEKFIVQLQKDFELCGMSGDFCRSLKPDYELILLALTNVLEKSGKKNADKLNELLYRIDVSELQIKKLTKQKPIAKFEILIAELIIKRELQKIVFKQFYKNNE